MDTRTRHALLALLVAGTLWGSTVALTKLALPWLGPGWLTVGRFLLAAPVLALVGRRGLREAVSADVLGSGALGFGLVIILQNAGIAHTSVSHAAVLVGAVPVLVAVVGAMIGDGHPGVRGWIGCGVSLGGIVLVARGGGGGASVGGDLLVAISVVFSAVFIAFQSRVLRGRDAASVTAVQFAAGAAVALPMALLAGGLPRAPESGTAVLAFFALVVAGTIVPFWLFAFGQARVSAALAGVFVNLEPVVGVAIGWLAFGDPAGRTQIVGVAIVIGAVALSAASRPERVLGALARAWHDGLAAHAALLQPGPGRSSLPRWTRRTDPEAITCSPRANA